MSIVACHQPNLLPSTRFFYKFAKADVLDLRWQAQFIDRGYIHRVKMRDRWFTLPLNPKPRLDPIDTVRVDLPKAKDAFRKTMHGRYSGAKYYKSRGKDLIEKFDSLEREELWLINLELIIHLQDLLGITTPISLGVPAIGGKGDGVLSTLRAYPDCDVYLSGTGAQKYMGDTSNFTAAGITVKWSRHAPVTDDSIVSILMDHDNPMEFVLKEEKEQP